MPKYEDYYESVLVDGLALQERWDNPSDPLDEADTADEIRGWATDNLDAILFLMNRGVQ